MATSWFKYNGGSGTNPELNPVNYTKIVSTFCADGNTVCAIFAVTQVLSGTDRPVIDANLSSDITVTLARGTQSSNVKLFS